MDALPIETIVDFCGGSLLNGRASAVVQNLVTDTRSIKQNDLFLALRGDKFDGHRFIPTCIEKGAIGAIVDKDYVWSHVPADFIIVQVEDTLAALQSLATRYRKSLGLKVVAITGSNGKTSTKDIAAALLSQRFKVIKTDGNFNNHIGVPLTFLRATSIHEVAVIEIGMNHPGEIAPLAAIAAPDVAIITNVGTAHVEHMKTREAIAVEKSVLAEAVEKNGQVILHGCDDYYNFVKDRCTADVTTVGIVIGDIQASNIHVDGANTTFLLQAGGDSVQAILPVLGEHMVVNALLAVGAACALGVSLAECAQAMAGVKLSKARLELKSMWGFDILDDSYNANPDSMSAAIRTLAKVPTGGRRIAVLGKMGELGSYSKVGHWDVGQVAAEQNIDQLIGVGSEAEIIVESAKSAGLAEANAVRDVQGAAALIYRTARPGDVILIKGSRSAAMEGTLNELSRMFENRTEIPASP